MKKAIFGTYAIMLCMLAFISLSSFSYNQNPSLSKSKVHKPEAITFHTVSTSSEGSTYFGTVEVSGGITAQGTYTMPTELMGMALHCTLFLELPDGDITIRMNCNMVTFNGSWQILEGSGAYANLKGNGSLNMPDDVQEILIGKIRWQK